MSNFTRTSYSSCLISDNSLEYYASIGYLPDSVRHTWIILSVVNSIASPLTIAINLLIIWTVVKDESLRKVNYNILLAALAVTDLIVGLVVEPLFAFQLICRLQGCSTPCIFTAYFIISVTCAGSTLIVFMVSSVERYLAIEHNQFYLENVTTKKIILSTLAICVVGMPATLSPRILLDHGPLRRVPVAVVVGLNVLIILYCSIKVQVTAYRQRRAISTQEATVQLQQEEQEEQQRRLQEYKGAFTMGLLVLASILLYFPFIINTILLATNVVDRSSLISTPGFAATFIHLQSLLNPIIVSLRLSYIREGVKNKLCCRE